MLGATVHATMWRRRAVDIRRRFCDIPRTRRQERGYNLDLERAGALRVRRVVDGGRCERNLRVIACRSWRQRAPRRLQSHSRRIAVAVAALARAPAYDDGRNAECERVSGSVAISCRTRWCWRDPRVGSPPGSPALAHVRSRGRVDAATNWSKRSGPERRAARFAKHHSRACWLATNLTDGCAARRESQSTALQPESA